MSALATWGESEDAVGGGSRACLFEAEVPGAKCAFEGDCVVFTEVSMTSG